jgi:Neuraminidase (sialidase)
MAYKYSVKANWGKNSNGDSFIRHEDRKMFHIEGFPGDVWVTDDNVYAERWIARVAGTEKTKSQAQTIVTTVVDDNKDTWDNDNVEGETSAEKITRLGPKPTDITLP